MIRASRTTAVPRRPHLLALSLGLVLAAGAAASLAADTYSLTQNKPAADIWEYPFAGNPGGNLLGPTFGAVGNSDFDNRDGQFYMRFDTGATIPTGLSLSSYQIVSVKITLSVNTGGGKIYDPTYDPVSTYKADGSATAGDDPGRPMEMYGAGYRNGVTSTSVSESTPFSTAGQPVPRTRSVYPTDFLAAGSLNGASRDVSNNVTDQFDPTPFAIGQVAPADLGAGGTINEDGRVVFTLTLSADVIRYLQMSLAEGRLGLIATSMEQASQFGDVTYPDYYTKENTLGASPKLELVVNVVPEPGPPALVLTGALFWLNRRRRSYAREHL